MEAESGDEPLQVRQSWEALGNRYYRKLEMYRMDWFDDGTADGIDLSRYITAVAPFGGPIALTRDTSVMLPVKGAAAKPGVELYSASGLRLGFVPWDKGRIVGLGWTNAEEVLVMCEDGSAHLFSITGQFVRTFNMGQGPMRDGVVEMQMAPGGTGLACLTAKNRFYGVANIDRPRPKPLAQLPEIESEDSTGVTGWCVLDNEGVIQVLAAADENLFILDPDSCFDPALADNQLEECVSMAVSANGKFVALFSVQGKVMVFSTDFKVNKVCFNTETTVPPRQLVWCGSDSVVVYWDQLNTGTDTLLMVGPDGRWLNYSYDSRVILAQEHDGLRIITNELHEFVEAVPPVTHRIGEIASVSDASLLFAARHHFDEKDPRADDLIRDLKDREDNPDALVLAIDDCLEAAGLEWKTKDQKKLLRAARFGKDFVDTPAEAFMKTCQDLRILHHVRDYRIGIPITYRQLKKLTIPVLNDRLIARGLYWLAFEICKYRKLEDKMQNLTATNRVLVHWACNLIKNQNADDDTIADTIIDKLGDTTGISFAEIAQAAISRKHLARRLIAKEPRASEQVPLLLSMGEDEEALFTAVDSGDTDLAYFVIMHLKEKCQAGELYRIVEGTQGERSSRTRHVIRDMFIQYCREDDKKALGDFFFQHDQVADLADLKVVEAYTECSNFSERRQALRDAWQLYDRSKAHSFQSQMAEEQVRLLEDQRTLEKKYPQPFVGLSLYDTLFECILQGEVKRANDIRSKFKVPDKRYWWIKVKALAQSRNWQELEKFAKSKKSPIGYEAFVQQCIQMSNRNEARKYIARLPADLKVTYYLRIAALTEAVEAAFASKNDDLVAFVADNCGGRRDILKMIADRRG